MYATMRISVCGLLCILGLAVAEAAIVPPPWADPGNNPCASRPGGWQLLLWPQDGKCYKIFTRGAPCPETMELTPGVNRTAECRCPPGSALLATDRHCHSLYTTTPCPQGQYFAPALEQLGERLGVCREVTPCSRTGDIFYPRDEQCYAPYSQGPCLRGQLLAPSDSQSQLGECRCEDSGRLGRHYWPESGTCHPHFTTGPCLERGTLFLPKGTCGCHTHLPQYHPSTGLCYQIGTVGPCPAGHTFVLPENSQSESSDLHHAECRCKTGHVRWPEDGVCYRPFTRGPCPQGQMFSINLQGGNTTAVCEPLPCLPGRLYFPGGKGCHRVGSQGPCPPGQVVLFQESVRTSVEGISYQGICGCPTQTHNERSFYPMLRADENTPLNSRCPSQSRKDDNNVDFTGESRGLSLPSIADRCGEKRGFIAWSDGSCQQLYRQGPCPPGQWVVPDHGRGRRRGRGGAWRAGKCECLPAFTASLDSTGRLTCLPPTVRLARYLNTHSDMTL